ncbi:hypothetical protein PENSPDRAFT_749857 [Peniophora sp. CONT]|nr:hypothetical protein PENSPDRAFT_749857 [Peniophora sp. CONT]
MSNIDSERGRSVEQSTWEAFTKSRYDAVGALSNKDARVQAMERELAALDASRILARRLRNAGVSFACGLPPEVLTIIFSYLQAIWQPEHQAILNGNRTSGWMTALGVCSIWREAIINTPVLWTHIPCSTLSPHYIPMFLSRSRSLPLGLTFATYTKEPSKSPLRFWFSPTILRRAKAIEYVDSGRAADPGLWQELSKHAMPHLESLDISIYNRMNSNAITQDIFPSPTGRPYPLRRLSLHDCFLPLGSPLLSASLTHLSLSSHDSPSAPVSLRLSDLLALPSLRQLQLVNVFPNVQEYQGFVALPSCFQLLMTRAHAYHTPALSTACLDFVQRLRLPPAATACLDLYTPAEATTVEELDGVLKTFFDYSTRSAIELRVEAAMIGVIYGDRPREEWTQCISEAAETYTKDKVHAARHMFSTEPSVVAMIACINLTQLTSVYLFDSALRPESTDNLLGALESATRLHRIALQSPWRCQPLLHALGHCSEPQDTKSASPRLPFPHLEVIIIHDHGEDPPIYEEEPEYKDRLAEISCLTASIVDLLERRSGHGMPVRELLVEDTLKDWDVWKMVEAPTVVKFFQYTPASVWKPNV